MPDKNKKNKEKSKSSLSDSNDQLGENAYEPYANEYDNKGKKGKAQK